MTNRREISDSEILAQIPAARARGELQRVKGLRALSAQYDRAGRRILIELSNSYLLGVPVRAVPSLEHASEVQLTTVEVSPAGGALRWQALDVDLSVPGLVLSAMERAERMSELARIAGSTKSSAKAEAARANGALGGRPRESGRYDSRQSSSHTTTDRTVSRRNDGQWVNKKDGAGRASSLHNTQKQAAAAARAQLRNSGGGELKVKGEDGKIRSKDTISPLKDSRHRKG